MNRNIFDIEIIYENHLVYLWNTFVHMSWWRHLMETYSALLAIGARNSPMNFPHKGQWRGALILSLICAWLNGRVINREVGDLIHYHAHCDIIIMYCLTNILRGSKGFSAGLVSDSSDDSMVRSKIWFYISDWSTTRQPTCMCVSKW